MYTSSSARAFCAFLFLIVAAQCNAQNLTTSAPTLPSQVQVVGDAHDIYYDVGRELAFRCDLQPANGQDIVWKKNGTVLTENERLKFSEQFTVLRYARSQEDDYGPYSCVVGDRERAFYARGRPRIKLPANSNVVEGQNLRLTCKVVGRPYPAIEWLFSNDTMKNISVNEVLGLRAAVNVSDQGVEGGELLLREVLRSDAGNFTCYIVTKYPDGHLDNSTTIVRVKDKYAALWPFLGICIEVFVLCAIILVYEKRRTKPELDDSDTDNHDQKKS